MARLRLCSYPQQSDERRDMVIEQNNGDSEKETQTFMITTTRTKETAQFYQMNDPNGKGRDMVIEWNNGDSEKETQKFTITSLI